jgi:hypothetical protein
MEAVLLFAILAVAFILLGAAAAAWGVDSRFTHPA